MLKIRLQRVGRKHEPSFRLVLTESENSSKSGRFKEVLGSYDPRKQAEALKADRIQYWMGQGALATGSVSNLLVKKGIVRGKKAHVGADFVKKEKPAEEAPAEPVEASAEPASEAASPAEEAPQAPAEAAPESSPEETPTA